jgi:hypothetical protein
LINKKKALRTLFWNVIQHRRHLGKAFCLSFCLSDFFFSECFFFVSFLFIMLEMSQFFAASCQRAGDGDNKRKLSLL